jgi:WD40 repeat protein
MSIRKVGISPLNQNLQDLEADLSQLKALGPFNIPIASFTFNMIFPSDSRSIIFTTDRGVAVCNKSALEVVKSSKISDIPILSIAYSEHSSLLYLGDRKGNIHIANSKSFIVENIIQVFSAPIYKIILNFDEIILYMCSGNSEVVALELNTLDRKVLYNHDGTSVQTMDLSNDGEFLVTGGEKLIKMYSIMQETVLKVINLDEGVVNCVKFSFENDRFMAGMDNGDIKSWNLQNWDEKVFKGHSMAVTRIVFALGVMVSGSNDKTVRIWSTSCEIKPIKIFCKGGITDIGIDDQYIYYSHPNHIEFINIPKFPNELTIQAHKKNITDLVYSSKKKFIFSCSGQEQVIKVWNSDKLENFYLVKELENESPVRKICLSGDQLHIYASLANKTIKKWSLEDYNGEAFAVSDSMASYIICSPDNNYLISIDSACRCIIRNTSDGSTLHTFTHHKLSGISLAVTHLSNILLTLGSDNTIFIYDLFQGKNIGKMEGFSSEGNKIKVSLDDRLLAMSTLSEGVYIFSIEKQTILIQLKIKDYNCYDLMFTQDNKYLMVLGNNMNGNKIFLYSLQGFQYITSIVSSGSSNSFCLSCDERFIVLSEGCNIFIRDNPLKIDYFCVIGPTTNYPDTFHKYLNDLITGQSHAYNAEMNDYLILPSLLSAVHYYAYKNLNQHLEQALASGHTPFLSRNSLDIMRISLDLGLVDSVRIILKHITDNLKSNTYSACFLENCLIDLTKESHYELEELYNSLMFAPVDKSLPRFSNYPETFYMSEFFEINPKLMIPDSIPEVSVKFLQSGVRVCTEIGAKDSIEYLEALLATGNSEIFRSKFVGVLLEEKWKEVRWFAEAYAGFYFLYLVILSLYTLRNESAYFVILLIQNAVLVVYEVYQVGLTGVKYFKEGLNFVDLARIIFFIVYFVLDTQYGELLFLLNLVSWTRGVSHFRIFASTRYLVNLIVEVIKDIGPFLTLLFYFTLGFTFMMLSLESTNQYEDFLKIEDILMLNFGDFYISNKSGSWQWVCFTISSLVNFLIMVNLLISIIGDTYDKVQNYREIADRKEMTEIILEIENLVVWKRKENIKKFIHFMSMDRLSDEKENWQGKVREIQEKMAGIEGLVKDQKVLVEIKLDSIGNDIDEIKKNLEKLMKAQNIG